MWCEVHTLLRSGEMSGNVEINPVPLSTNNR
nr:MAG TPA: hypothetical protein [Caudoviricetes sp.]